MMIAHNYYPWQFFKRCQVTFFHGCQNDDIYRVWMLNTLETLKVKLQFMIRTHNLAFLQEKLLFHLQIILEFNACLI